MPSDSDFTEEQLAVINCLPATRNEISRRLGISSRAVRGRMDGIEDRGGKLDHDEDYVWYWNGEEHQHRISSRHKSTVTKHANRHLAELESNIKGLLRRSNPPTTSLDTEEEGMDIVIHRSDDHIGQVVYDDRGERIYDTPTAVERIKKVIQRAIQKARHYEEVTGRSIDNVHLVLGGDTVTNENIYDHQPYNIDNTLDKQIEIAVQVYHECLLSLSREFESIHVVCQGGNHGDIRASGSSKKANADDIAYAMLDFSARVDDELDNVHFTRNDSTNYTNFMLRGHRAHIRHGDDCRLHIGTSSPQSDWRGWKLDHEFDIAYRGHYHEWRMEHVRDAPILMSGSLCPVGEYEESLSVRSQPVATIHGVTDETPMAWVEPISFS